eukprot:356396-Chlamydomonas_euryale.AAC.8
MAVEQQAADPHYARSPSLRPPRHCLCPALQLAKRPTPPKCLSNVSWSSLKTRAQDPSHLHPPLLTPARPLSPPLHHQLACSSSAHPPPTGMSATPPPPHCNSPPPHTHHIHRMVTLPHLNVSRSSTQTTASVVAATVAERGQSNRSEISPKQSPRSLLFTLIITPLRRSRT